MRITKRQILNIHWQSLLDLKHQPIASLAITLGSNKKVKIFVRILNNNEIEKIGILNKIETEGAFNIIKSITFYNIDTKQKEEFEISGSSNVEIGIVR